MVPLEWELKELASHAVVCLVSYGVQLADRETGHLELVTRSYRKVGRVGFLHDATTPLSRFVPRRIPSDVLTPGCTILSSCGGAHTHRSSASRS